MSVPLFTHPTNAACPPELMDATFFRLCVHQCWCHRCQKSFYESFPFLSSPKARITKALEQLILKRRAEMSIKGIAEHFNISWDTVKDVEKRFLADKYRHVPLGKVRGITVDEMKVFNRGRPSKKFITIVRDAETGDVLSVSRGKGADALKMFASRIRRSGAKIRYVCMDMSKAYTAWAKETIPQAEIVYDRFHLVKMMNKRLHGGLQRQGALAHQAGLRLQGLQVLPAQDIRPPVNRHPQAALGGSHE